MALNNELSLALDEIDALGVIWRAIARLDNSGQHDQAYHHLHSAFMKYAQGHNDVRGFWRQMECSLSSKNCWSLALWYAYTNLPWINQSGQKHGSTSAPDEICADDVQADQLEAEVAAADEPHGTRRKAAKQFEAKMDEYLGELLDQDAFNFRPQPGAGTRSMTRDRITAVLQGLDSKLGRPARTEHALSA
jgi:hypothetical protein